MQAYVLPVAVCRSFCDDSAIHYVLPVLWMTSRLPITDHTARGVGNTAMYVGVVLLQVVIHLQRIRQGAPRCLTVIVYTVVATCAPGGEV